MKRERKMPCRALKTAETQYWSLRKLCIALWKRCDRQRKKFSVLHNKIRQNALDKHPEWPGRWRNYTSASELFQCHGPEFAGVSGPGKVSVLHALVKKQESIPFPEQSLNPGSGFPTEEKERIGNKQIHVILLLNNGGQGVDAVAKIRIVTYYVDSCEVIRVSISKHSAPPW